MTDLSPAAQEVFTAAWTCSIILGDRPATRSLQIAAALRAAADQVAPFPGRYPMNEYMEGLRDARQNVWRELLAIAAELEAL